MRISAAPSAAERERGSSRAALGPRHRSRQTHGLHVWPKHRAETIPKSSSWAKQPRTEKGTDGDRSRQTQAVLQHLLPRRLAAPSPASRATGTNSSLCDSSSKADQPARGNDVSLLPRDRGPPVAVEGGMTSSRGRRPVGISACNRKP